MKNDITTIQHGCRVIARGEHRSVRNCRTCQHIATSYWTQPCMGCRQARNVDGLPDKWEPAVDEDAEEEAMYYGARPSKTYTERVIREHMKQIRDIARKYVGKNLYLTCNMLDNGYIHCYNSAVYSKSGLPIIDVTCDADD